MTAKTVNGVEVARLAETIDAIKHDAALAACRYRASNRWHGGGYNETTFTSFYGAGGEHRHATPFVVSADEPPFLLGSGRAASPVEHMLHALAACLTTTFAYHAAARGIEVEEIDSRLEGDIDLRGFFGLDTKVRSGCSTIRVVLRVKAKAPPETIAELGRLAQARSPVFDIVSRGLPVSVAAEPKPPSAGRALAAGGAD